MSLTFPIAYERHPKELVSIGQDGKERKAFLSQLRFKTAPEKTYYGNAANVPVSVIGGTTNMPLRLRLPPLQTRWTPKVWTSGSEPSSASLEVSFDLALTNTDAQDALRVFQALDDKVQTHMLQHRTTLFPGLSHLKDEQLASLYQPCTAPSVGKEGRKYSPRLRLRIKKAFSLVLPNGKHVTELESLQKLAEEEPLQFERRYLKCFVEVKGFTLRDGKATLQVQLLVGKFLTEKEEDELHESCNFRSTPGDVFGDAGIIVSSAVPVSGESLKSDYGEFL